MSFIGVEMIGGQLRIINSTATLKTIKANGHKLFEVRIDLMPMVPIVIHNSGDVAPKGDFVFRPATVEVDVLPPVDTSDWRSESIEEHVAEVRDMFLDTLGQRAQTVPEAPKAASAVKKIAPKKKTLKKSVAKKAAVKKLQRKKPSTKKGQKKVLQKKVLKKKALRKKARKKKAATGPDR